MPSGSWLDPGWMLVAQRNRPCPPKACLRRRCRHVQTLSESTYITTSEAYGDRANASRILSNEGGRPLEPGQVGRLELVRPHCFPCSSTMSNGSYNPYTNAPPVAKNGKSTTDPFMGFMPRNVNAAQVTKVMVSSQIILNRKFCPSLH